MKQKSRLGDRVRSQTDSQSACTANNLGQASDAKQQKIWYAISSLNLCDNFDIFYNSYTFWWFLHFLTILTFLDDFEFVCRFWQLLTIVYICLHIFTVQSTKYKVWQSTKYKVQSLTIFDNFLTHVFMRHFMVWSEWLWIHNHHFLSNKGRAARAAKKIARITKLPYVFKVWIVENVFCRK